MSKYFSARSPGDAVEGWRIHYQTEDGRLYSSSMHNLLRQDKSLEINPTEVNHSITEHGYYYWATKEAAEEYMSLLLSRMSTEVVPRGILRLDKVRGIEVARSTQDADSFRMLGIMEDMQIIY